MPKEKNNNLQPNLSDSQPSLFDLPKTRSTTDDFLTPDGKKKKSIPTGMTRSEINKLGRNKGKRKTGNTNWPNEY